MTRARAVPRIAKPVVDVQAALRFAEEAGPPDPKPPAAPAKAAPAGKSPPPGQVRLDLVLPADLYGRLVKHAERKGRTPAEALVKLMKKHLE